MCACVVKPLLEPLPPPHPMQNENTHLHMHGYPQQVGWRTLVFRPLPPTPPSHAFLPPPPPSPPPHTPCKRAPPHAVVEVGRADPGQIMATLLQSTAEHGLQVSERPALRMENNGGGMLVVRLARCGYMRVLEG